MSLKSDLRKLLHGEQLTQEQREAHEEAREAFHLPAVVHRTGGPSASKLNCCGICGSYIVLKDDVYWIAITEEEAEVIRNGK